MTILITGVNGQVGKNIVKKFTKLGNKIISLSRLEWDMDQQLFSGESILFNCQPKIVINLAAFTNVEGSEDNENKAMRINAFAPRILARACNKMNIPIIHVSTDYVFDGSKKGPYLESDYTRPINAYGRSKLAGEIAVKQETDKYIILRTSWVFSKDGNNFVNTILKLANEKKKLDIVNDQIGGPTYAGSIADVLIKLTKEHNKKWGVYHYSGQPFVSWFQFAQKIIEVSSKYGKIQKIPTLKPIRSKDFLTKALRPINSTMSSNLLHNNFNIQSNNWIKSLIQILK